MILSMKVRNGTRFGKIFYFYFVNFGNILVLKIYHIIISQLNQERMTTPWFAMNKQRFVTMFLTYEYSQGWIREMNASRIKALVTANGGVGPRSQLDNWGGGGHIYIFVFCIINFFWNRLFLRSVNTNIWICPRPPNYRAGYATDTKIMADLSTLPVLLPG
jgi:hypothetical protein